MESMVLSVNGLNKAFGKVQAVRNVSFNIREGTTFGLVGESGSGKSTIARLVLRLIESTSGEVYFKGSDLTRLSHRQLQTHRRHMQMIFQDPYGSLNPRMTVRATLSEPLLVHKLPLQSPSGSVVERLIEEVRLPKAALDRYPHEFSGGQRQRIAIARALATNPEFIVADEAVSALDVSVQAQVLNLMLDLQARHRTTMLFISHDLRVVQFMCDEIAVLYLGEIVEQGSREQIYKTPAHPYTRALLSSTPGSGRQERMQISGEIPSANNIPSGCAFRTRCPLAFDKCSAEHPESRDLGDGHRASCHLLD